jgi:hypothetical protein
MTTGIIIAVIIGSVAVLGAVGTLIGVLMCKKKRAKKEMLKMTTELI